MRAGHTNNLQAADEGKEEVLRDINALSDSKRGDCINRVRVCLGRNQATEALEWQNRVGGRTGFDECRGNSEDRVGSDSRAGDIGGHNLVQAVSLDRLMQALGDKDSSRGRQDIL